MSIGYRDDGNDGREHRPRYVGQFDMIKARQQLMDERAALRYRLHEIDEELSRIDAAQEINNRL